MSNRNIPYIGRFADNLMTYVFSPQNLVPSGLLTRLVMLCSWLRLVTMYELRPNRKASSQNVICKPNHSRPSVTPIFPFLQASADLSFGMST